MEVNHPVGAAGHLQSVHRALDVLEAIGTAGEVGTSALARDLGLAISTAHGIIRTLAARGYVVRTRNGYRLGPSAMVLASQWDPEASLTEIMKEALQKLTTMTGHAATATVLIGDRARRLGYEPGPGLVNASYGDTFANPLSLATGMLLVATTREGDWDRFVTRGGDIKPEWSHDDWTRELQRIADTGVSFRRAYDQRGQMITGVGVPVYGAIQTVVCSIGCSMTGPPEPDDLDRMLDALWTVSADLSRRAGGELPFEEPPFDALHARVASLPSEKAPHTGR